MSQKDEVVPASSSSTHLTYQNLIGKPPQLDYVIVSDWETKLIFSIRQLCLDLSRGKFFYPPTSSETQKTGPLTEVEGPPADGSWLKYTVDVYGEASKYQYRFSKVGTNTYYIDT